MPEYIFAQYEGDIGFLFLPLEDSSIEVILMEVAGEHIKRLVAFQHTFHHTAWIQLVVEYLDGLLCFKNKAAVEDVGQLHFWNNVK